MSGSYDRHARIVIVGGGAIGCAVAYALTRRGEHDVLLLEKSQLTNGCTWHAAGLVGQLRGRKNLTRLMQNSVAVFDRLEAETGQAIDWRKVGSLRLASSADRWSEIRRSMTQAKSFGFECHSSRQKRRRSVPLYRSGRHRRARRSFPPTVISIPMRSRMAFAQRARKNGATLARRRDGHRHRSKRAGASSASRPITGRSAATYLVNCAGLWAKRVGEMAGVALAAGVVEHQYFVTEKKLDLPTTLPTLRDPDKNFYLKPDVGAFAIGGWEKGTKGCWRARPPFDFGRELFPREHGPPRAVRAACAERLPVLNEIGIQTVINGPIPVSADGEPIMGLAPELDNFYRRLRVHRRHRRLGRRRPRDGQLDPRRRSRHGPLGLRRAPLRRAAGARAGISRSAPSRPMALITRSIGRARKCEAAAVCGARPLHEHLKAAGAVFGAKLRLGAPATGFAIRAWARKEIPSFEDKPSWFEAVAEEHRAIRERVALIDQTSFSKFRDRRARRRGLPRPISAEPHRRRAGALRLHDYAQRARRRRGRGDAAPSRARAIRNDKRIGVRCARFELGAPASAQGQPDCSDGRYLRLGGPEPLRSEIAGGPAIRF